MSESARTTFWLGHESRVGSRAGIDSRHPLRHGIRAPEWLVGSLHQGIEAARRCDSPTVSCGRPPLAAPRENARDLKTAFPPRIHGVRTPLSRRVSTRGIRTASADLGEGRRALAGGGRLDECLNQLHVQRDVPLVLGVPLHAGDPPGMIFALKGLDQSIGRQCGHAEDRSELANALVVVAN